MKTKIVKTKKQNPPLVTELLDKLYQKYASDRTKKELSHKLTNTVTEIDGVNYQVLYLGRTVEYGCFDEFNEEWVEEFVMLINWLVAKGYLFYGHLAPLLKMPLTSKGIIHTACDKEGNVIKFGNTAPLKVDLKDIRHRAMILFYALSEYTRDELNQLIDNTFLGAELFNSEGALPKMWDEKMVRKLKRLKK